MWWLRPPSFAARTGRGVRDQRRVGQRVEFLTKPPKDDVLLEAIHSALEHSRVALRVDAEKQVLENCYQSLTPRWPEENCALGWIRQQGRTFQVRNVAMDALLALINDTKTARGAGSDDAALEQSRQLSPAVKMQARCSRRFLPWRSCGPLGSNVSFGGTAAPGWSRFQQLGQLRHDGTDHHEVFA